MIGFTLRGHLQTTRHSQVTSGAFPTGSRNPTYRTPQRTSGVRVRAPLGSTADEREGQAGDTRAIEEGKRRTEHGTAHTHHSPEHGTAHTHHSPEHGTAHTHTTRRNTARHTHTTRRNTARHTHTPLVGTRHTPRLHSPATADNHPSSSAAPKSRARAPGTPKSGARRREHNNTGPSSVPQLSPKHTVRTHQCETRRQSSVCKNLQDRHTPCPVRATALMTGACGRV